MAPVPEPGQDAGWLRTVADEVRSFDRSSTAERVAELLRRRVIAGDAARRGDWVAAGETDRAATELEVYLHGSEAQLVGAYRERTRRNP